MGWLGIQARRDCIKKDSNKQSKHAGKASSKIEKVNEAENRKLGSGRRENK